MSTRIVPSIVHMMGPESHRLDIAFIGKLTHMYAKRLVKVPAWNPHISECAAARRMSAANEAALSKPANKRGQHQAPTKEGMDNNAKAKGIAAKGALGEVLSWRRSSSRCQSFPTQARLDLSTLPATSDIAPAPAATPNAINARLHSQLMSAGAGLSMT